MGRDPVGTALYTVATGLGTAGTRFRTVGVVGTVGVAPRTVCVVCTLRTVHARPTLRGVRGL
ncbi:hypothetical protein SCAB_38712 [Streptomyces scabiei 87.22]|uniref:Uncharacterized protein n=1 Tax=Streptomyces scabiei (strain 87.22) TaxID=680198 RepID=C9YZ89_STRSW|nr:hypothetical protein [Streptomyces scabiei]MDX2904827.1 hypothetical protein [Streptomyces scabiei]CBG70952.1 hypothetical protein SCAB_38712 [Streptomyces scabiei 87.22]